MLANNCAGERRQQTRNMKDMHTSRGNGQRERKIRGRTNEDKKHMCTNRKWNYTEHRALLDATMFPQTRPCLHACIPFRMLSHGQNQRAFPDAGRFSIVDFTLAGRFRKAEAAPTPSFLRPCLRRTFAFGPS